MKNCKRNQSSSFRRLMPWLPGFIIAIIPKCPFCIMAYSGAVTLCSGKSIYPNAGSMTSVMTIILCAVIISGILLNNRGKKTIISLMIVITGIGLIIASQLVLMDSLSYTIGAFILLFGIWFNGSFDYFYRRITLKFRYIFTNTNKLKL